MLPTFLIIGAMKCGTGALYHQLRRQPGVFMSEVKELDFFSKDGLKRDWYESQFADSNGAQVVGEASTSYSKHPLYPGVPARIKALLPDVRLIYLVRDPVERMRSHYLHEVAGGSERRPIDQALLEDPDYLDFSRYAQQIDRYLEYFERDQLLILRSEQLKDAPAAALASVLEFIGVDSVPTPEQETEFHRTADKLVPRSITLRIRRIPGYQTIAENLPDALKQRYRRLGYQSTARWPAQIGGRVRDRLVDQLRDDLIGLRIHMGIDFDGWGLI